MRRYLRDAAAIEKKSPPRRAHKLDPHRDYIEQRMQAAHPAWLPATVLLGEIIERSYTGGLTRLRAFMRSLRAVEHGAVAFDVYHKLYGDHEWYRKWMILKALLHIAMETTKAYTHMAKVEGWLRNPWSAVSKMGFNFLMLWRLFSSALPVFLKSYHPRKHPLVTHKQNRIQIAWRRYVGGGGNVLDIDREKMAQILGVALP